MLAFRILSMFAVAEDAPIAYMFGVQAMPAWIFVCVGLAGGLFFFGRKLQNTPLRMASFAPLLVCLLVGIQGVLKLQDPIFYDYFDVTDKRVAVHWALVVIPILAGIAVAVFEFVIGKRDVRKRL